MFSSFQAANLNVPPSASWCHQEKVCTLYRGPGILAAAALGSLSLWLSHSCHTGPSRGSFTCRKAFTRGILSTQNALQGPTARATQLPAEHYLPRGLSLLGL